MSTPAAARQQVKPLQTPAAKALRPEPRLWLSGLKVCHLTPLQNRRDERAFSRECLPAIPYGLVPTIVGPHGVRAKLEGVSFVAIPAKRNRFLRMLFALRMVRWALSQDAGIYHVHSPEMIPAALTLKLVFGKRVVYDSREDFPAMMLTKTYLPRPLRKMFSKGVAALERLAARCLDGVVTADSGSLRPLAKTGRSRKLVLYNFPNLRYYPEPAGRPKKYDLVYRGGLSERAGTFDLLQAMRMLTDSGWSPRLLLFGYSDNAESTLSILKALESLGIAHLVTLGGVIAHEDMADTLSSARIMVCPLQKIPKFLNNLPVKVFEAWACGLPVIATDLPPIRPFLQHRPYGILVKPNNPANLAKAVGQLLSSPELMEEYGRQARQAALDRYNNATEARKLVSFYKRIYAC